MSSRYVFRCCLTSLLAAAATYAFADDPATIHVTWSGGTPTQPSDYRVDATSPNAPSVELRSGGTWTIWSVDTDNPLDLGNIGTITCPANANFTVNVLNGSFRGALDVRAFNLVPTSSSNHSSIGTARFAGDCEGIDVRTNSSGTGGNVGTIIIDGDLNGNVSIPGQLQTLLEVKGDITGGVNVECSIYIADMDGSASFTQSVNGFGPPDFEACLTLDSDLTYGEAISIAGVPTAGATVDVGEVAGQVALWSGNAGTINLGSVTETGRLDLGGYVGGDITIGGVEAGSIEGRGLVNLFNGFLTGDLHVSDSVGTGDVAGEIIFQFSELAFDGELLIDGDLSGTLAFVQNTDVNMSGGDVVGSVLILGDMTENARITIDNGFSHLAEIVIAGEMSTTAGIATDYNGWDDGDGWACGGTITVDSATYYRNTPGAHVWEITMRRGDINNDCVVNYFDIDPFALALSDPGQYALDFPGLEGSRVYHGDANESGLFDNYDIDPFITLVLVGDTSGECTPCGMDPEDLYSVADAASILTTYVAEIRWPAVRAIVADVAATHPRAARRAFWSDVLELLNAR